MNDGSLATARLLVFRVGNLACAAEVDQVREILPRLPTTRIPGAPPVVAGLVNVRGTLVTVVEGWRALGQPAPAAPAPSEGSILILEIEAGGSGKATTEGETGRKLLGFTVDEVMDMVAAGDTALEDRQGLAGVDPRLVRAVGRGTRGVFIVLNVPALLGPILTSRGEGGEQ